MLPEKDPTKPNSAQGLFRKFDVRRTDGSDAPGGKHDGCDYFVLDVTHDKHAKPALAAYAAAVEATHPQLAADMRAQYALPEQARGVPAVDFPEANPAIRESGWLIERQNSSGSPVWFVGGAEIGTHSWTAESGEAIRFSRRIDAERALALLLIPTHTIYVSEHVWISRAPEPPAAVDWSLPAGWYTFVHDCAQTAGGMVDGNRLSMKAKGLLESTTAAQPEAGSGAVAYDRELIADMLSEKVYDDGYGLKSQGCYTVEAITEQMKLLQAATPPAAEAVPSGQGVGEDAAFERAWAEREWLTGDKEWSDKDRARLWWNKRAALSQQPEAKGSC